MTESIQAGSLLPPAAWFQAYRPEDHEDPYPFYRRLQSEQPILYLEERRMWAVSRYEDVERILKSPAAVRERRNTLPPEKRDQVPAPAPQWASIRRITDSWMLFRDAPSHTRLRGLVQPAFSPRRTERLRASVTVIAGRLAATLAEMPEPDLIADFAFPLPVLVVADLLGVPSEDHALFKEWSHAVARLLDVAIVLPDDVPVISRAMEEMEVYFADLIRARRKSPGEDLISSLLAAADSGDRLSETELISTCILLLVAGHETTVHLIGNAVQLLLTHPDELALLRSNPRLLPSAVEETLRFESPVQMTDRLLAEPLLLGGERLEQGANVMLLLASANRDSDRFPEADRFRVSRSPNRHLAFASGPHFCLGAPLARVEGEEALRAFLAVSSAPELVPEKSRRRATILFRGWEELRVRL
ncbi:cytochrome P450 [Paenibacillus sp. J31TS4]|uniref:cytochrome P450 n=1 Tax=Paenibacillus sp. J31TS4 TaxID=2807195 RepID=UPI001B2257AF|nr:cytochrome P450 [Paenibacillus sp. J31TS4]GIP37530.1 cytochrome P450 [Paenibacillus sp. J31TS4]